jgi:hypothetical protein
MSIHCTPRLHDVIHADQRLLKLLEWYSFGLQQVQNYSARLLGHTPPSHHQLYLLSLLPCTPRLHDVIHADRRLYLVFEYLDLDLKKLMDGMPNFSSDHRLIKVGQTVACRLLHANVKF